MLFGPKEPRIRQASGSPVGRGSFEGKGMPRHTRRHSDVSCAKAAEPIEMPFGLWSQVGPGKHVLGGSQDHLARGQLLGGKGMPDDTTRSVMSCATRAQQ